MYAQVVYINILRVAHFILHTKDVLGIGTYLMCTVYIRGCIVICMSMYNDNFYE